MSGAVVVRGAARLLHTGFYASDGLGWQDVQWTQLGGWYMTNNSYRAGMFDLPNPSIPPSEPEKWYIKASADMNGDGYQDLIWQRNDGYI